MHFVINTFMLDGTIYTAWPKVCGHLTSKIPFKILGINVELVHTLCLGRLYNRHWSITAGICFHSARRAIVWPSMIRLRD
uniref:Uncharacterized protein n=1 Tax=Anguilla anguilla TaxID=7936 RepID=A0A0E9X0N6_ANGAN